MKIFFVSRDANWQLYRNEIFTKLAQTYNYKIEILTTGKLKPYLKENEVLHYKFFKNFFAANKKASFFPGALKYILNNKPDVVIGFDNTSQLTEYLTFIFCKLYKINYIWWSHGYDHLPLKNKFLRYLREKYKIAFLRKADVVITFSKYGKEYLIDKKVKEQNIYVAPNTLDTDKLLLLNERIKEAFDRVDFIKKKFRYYDEKEKNIILLFSGRLNKNKKVENALLTLASLIRYNIRASLYILGEGEEENNLRTMAKKLDIENNIYFAGPVYDAEESGKYFLSSDVFIMPGYVGLAIVHAFCFALPLITEDIKIHSPEIQYLHHGVNGYFIKENDIEQMTDVIRTLSSDGELLNKLQTGAKETILHEANIHNMINGMNQAINRALSK